MDVVRRNGWGSTTFEFPRTRLTACVELPTRAFAALVANLCGLSAQFGSPFVSWVLCRLS